MKKVLSFILVLAMLLSSGLVALADEGPGTEGPENLVVSFTKLVSVGDRNFPAENGDFVFKLMQGSTEIASTENNWNGAVTFLAPAGVYTLEEYDSYGTFINNWSVEIMDVGDGNGEIYLDGDDGQPLTDIYNDMNTDEVVQVSFAKKVQYNYSAAEEPATEGAFTFELFPVGSEGEIIGEAITATTDSNGMVNFTVQTGEYLLTELPGDYDSSDIDIDDGGTYVMIYKYGIFAYSREDYLSEVVNHYDECKVSFNKYVVVGDGEGVRAPDGAYTFTMTSTETEEVFTSTTKDGKVTFIVPSGEYILQETVSDAYYSEFEDGQLVTVDYYGIRRSGYTLTSIYNYIEEDPLTITKTVSKNNVKVNENVDYTITIENNTNDPMEFVILDIMNDTELIFEDTVYLQSKDDDEYQPYTHTYSKSFSNPGEYTNTVTAFIPYNDQARVASSADSEMIIKGEPKLKPKKAKALGQASATVTVTALPPVIVTPPVITTPSVPNVTLTVNVEGQGTVLPGAGTYSRSQGSVQVFSGISAAAGWEFAGWAGADGSQVVGNNLLLDGNKQVTAVFKEIIPEAPPVIEEPQVPESAPEETADTPKIEVAEEAVPLADPELPKTGGIPLELLMSAGALLTVSGLISGRRKIKK